VDPSLNPSKVRNRCADKAVAAGSFANGESTIKLAVAFYDCAEVRPPGAAQSRQVHEAKDRRDLFDV
jgi:hypothetical protein